MRKLAAITFAALVLTGCGSTASDGSGSTKRDEATETSVPKGLASTDASKDVGVPECKQDATTGTTAGTVKVTNSSSKRSDYSITVVLESAGGKEQVETTFGSVEALEPGQVASADLYFTKAMPEGGACRVA